MAIVTGTCQPLGGNRTAFRPCARLQDVEEGEAHCLLHFRVSFKFDICIRPEIVQEIPLLGEQTFPTGGASGGPRGPWRVVDGRPGTQTRPTIGDESDKAEPLAGL